MKTVPRNSKKLPTACRRPVLLSVCVAALLAGAGPTGTAGAEEVVIAGVKPAERPVAAPVVRDLEKQPGWYTRALTGISEPYPLSLQFLERQGNWYTPFIRPGMTGVYDIRGWHGR